MATRLMLRCNAAALLLCFAAPAVYSNAETISGERLLPEHAGPSYIIDVAEAAAREKLAPPVVVDRRSRNGASGLWAVPNVNGSTWPASGQKNLVNKWGDAQMGIGFPGGANVAGAYFSAQGTLDTSAAGLRAIAYREGVEVAESEWLWNLSEQPQWLPMNFENVDRIIIEACAKSAAGAYYGLDDLSFTWANSDDERPVVLDFEDVLFKTTMTGSNYAGLVWESGGGVFGIDTGVPAPITFPGPEGPSEDDGTQPNLELGAGDGLSLLRSFQGMVRFESFTGSFPSDAHGSIGPNHFIEIVNSSIAIFRKSDGVRIQTLSLTALLPGSSGDPRAMYDHHSGRWVLIATNFADRIQLAVSRTSDPTGQWFSTSILASTGSDAGTFVDFPTLGIDANGIYIGWFPAGAAARLGIIAIDKAPLIANPPSLGAVTFFRGLPWERAFAPAYTFGSPAGEYIISTAGTTTLRIRRVNPPLANPTLTTLGTISVAGYTDPPDAPQAGSSTPVDAGDARLINAVFRDGSLWTTHAVNISGRAGVRWYQINPINMSLIQQGTISDPNRAYYYPSIAVNGASAMLVGFSGSNSGEFIGSWFAGRNGSDPLGTISAPERYRAGQSGVNNIDDFGRNRFGDYSHTSVDPADNRTFWTIQGYAHSSGLWGTQGAVIGFNDCNSNGIPDECELNCATCNNQPGCGTATDCNSNSVPDSCDIASGNSIDCNNNGVPDECEIAGGASDCDNDGIMDSCEIAAGSATDCNGNTVPDDCEIAGGAPDCNTNGLPDSCDIAAGAPDCNNNNIPDQCDISESVSLNSGDLAPIGGDSPQSFTFTDLPEAITNVTITLVASADLNTGTELLSVRLNGSSIGDLFVETGNDCANPPNVESLTLSAAAFNAAISGNGDDAFIEVTASAGVNSLQCNPSYVRIELSYTGLGAAGDANGNGIPDECEGGLPGDMNCDGVVTVSDIGGFVLALTDPAGYAAQFPGCNILNGDVNSDGSVSVSDIGPFVQLLTGGNP